MIDNILWLSFLLPPHFFICFCPFSYRSLTKRKARHFVHSQLDLAFLQHLRNPNVKDVKGLANADAAERSRGDKSSCSARIQRRGVLGVDQLGGLEKSGPRESSNCPTPSRFQPPRNSVPSYVKLVWAHACWGDDFRNLSSKNNPKNQSSKQRSIGFSSPPQANGAAKERGPLFLLGARLCLGRRSSFGKGLENLKFHWESFHFLIFC